MSEIRNELIRQYTEALAFQMAQRCEAEFLDYFSTMSGSSSIEEPFTLETLNRAAQLIDHEPTRQIIGSHIDAERLQSVGFDIMPSCLIPPGTFYLVDQSAIMPTFHQRFIPLEEISESEAESDYNRDIRGDEDYTIDEAWEALNQYRRNADGR